MKKIALALLITMLTSVSVAYAGENACYDDAGSRYGIHPDLLRAIAKVESSENPTAINKNKNGTYDIGSMQINTFWQNSLGNYWEHLGNECYNILVGAWILKQCMDKHGYTWKAVGCYHSPTQKFQQIYIRKVSRMLEKIKKDKSKTQAQSVPEGSKTTAVD